MARYRSAFSEQVAPARSPSQPPTNGTLGVAGRGSGLVPWVRATEKWAGPKRPREYAMAEPTAAGTVEILLTVFLKHRQSMNLAEIHQKLDATGFWQKFPPDGVEVVSWYGGTFRRARNRRRIAKGFDEPGAAARSASSTQ